MEKYQIFDPCQKIKKSRTFERSIRLKIRDLFWIPRAKKNISWKFELDPPKFDRVDNFQFYFCIKNAKITLL